MNEQWVQTRLEALRGEAESGRQMLAETEERAVELRQTLLRISGAIQVLEEGLRAESLEDDSATVDVVDSTVSPLASSG